MDMLVIRGGRPLQGRVRISGSKNAALPIMSAALLGEGPSRLQNVPDLVDVRTLSQVLQQLGVEVRREAGSDLLLEGIDERPCVAGYDLVRRMRASVCVLGPLLARRGKACVSLPGGCNIGHRPIELHLKGLAALGADLRIERGYVMAEARRLRGARVCLAGPFGSTVTGTCNVLAAATLARGVTVIESAACEPEVVDLASFLNRMGARVEGAGTPTIRIEGVDSLSGAEHCVIPDRIEAATLMCATAVTGGDVTLEGAEAAHLETVIEVLSEIGLLVEEGERVKHPRRVVQGERVSMSRSMVDEGSPLPPNPSPPRRVEKSWEVISGERGLARRAGAEWGDSIRVAGGAGLRGVECVATPYPGLPTDVQAQFTAVLTRAAGVSVVTDRVFPDRFMHVPELVRMGAQIRREGNSALIQGQARLSGANVMASDLRGGAALAVAALAAEGESCIRRIYHLDRGYERLEEKLRGLGADAARVRDEPGAAGNALEALERGRPGRAAAA
jgi:UDP-N-acetylglucosamine 1-carboxyvinyltransferase